MMMTMMTRRKMMTTKVTKVLWTVAWLTTLGLVAVVTWAGVLTLWLFTR